MRRTIWTDHYHMPHFKCAGRKNCRRFYENYGKSKSVLFHLKNVSQIQNEQTIVEVIPLGHAESGAEIMANETGTVRLELVNEKGEQTENE